MKKRMIAFMLTVMMVTALFTGCGGSSVAYDNGMVQEEAKSEAPAAGAPLYGASNSVADTAATNQKLIKRVYMETETEDMDALLPVITAKIGELGGYVESQELYNGSIQSSYRSRSVYMTVRIPAGRLSEFTAQVEGASNVVNYTENTEDVTLKYVDTESRVKALQVEQERLLELLAKAEDMSDLLKIESRLTEVRYELESYTSQLRALDNKVSYATVELSVRQVRVYTEVEPQTVWQRISGGFGENLHQIGENLTDFFVWVTVYSPQLIFWGLVIAGALLLLKRRFRKIPVRKAPVQKQEKDETT